MGGGRRGDGDGGDFVEEGFDIGIGNHFGEGRIGARLAYILIAFIGGAAQIDDAIGGVTILRIVLGQHEIEKAAIGNRAVTQNRSSATGLLEYVRIDFQSFMESLHSFGKLLLGEISVADIGVHAGHVGLQRERTLILRNGLLVLFLGVIGGAQIIVGVGKAAIDLGGALKRFASIIQLALLQLGNPKKIQVGGILGILLSEPSVYLHGVWILLPGHEDTSLKLVFLAGAERSIRSGLTSFRLGFRLGFRHLGAQRGWEETSGENNRRKDKSHHNDPRSMVGWGINVANREYSPWELLGPASCHQRYQKSCGADRISFLLPRKRQ